jgi:hypothetical protein
LLGNISNSKSFTRRTKELDWKKSEKRRRRLKYKQREINLKEKKKRLNRNTGILCVILLILFNIYRPREKLAKNRIKLNKRRLKKLKLRGKKRKRKW